MVMHLLLHVHQLTCASNIFTSSLHVASAPWQIIQSCNQICDQCTLKSNLNQNSTSGPIHITHYQATYAQKTINSVILELHGLPVFFSTIFLSTMDTQQYWSHRSCFILIQTIIDGKNGSIIFPGKRRACQYQFMPDNTEDNSDIREAYEYEWHLFGNTQTYGKLFRWTAYNSPIRRSHSMENKGTVHTP